MKILQTVRVNNLEQWGEKCGVKDRQTNSSKAPSPVQNPTKNIAVKILGQTRQGMSHSTLMVGERMLKKVKQ